MGGARNLKLGERGNKGQGTGMGNNFFCVSQMSSLFTCCAHQKNVAGFRGRNRGRKEGVRKTKPPEAETLLAFEHLMVATDLPLFNFLKGKK